MGRILCILFGLLSAILGWSTSAQEPPPAKPDGRAAQISKYLDEIVDPALEKYRVPGAIVTVVERNVVLVNRGFGYADYARERKVHGDTTRFRVGSLSKLVTATAIMRLVEDGRVDVSRDIEAYLPNLRVARSYAAPVTVHHLLTHTSGFDVSDIGDAARVESALLTISDFVRTHMTPQVAPAGKYMIYSNRGYTLLGAILESIRGQDFYAAVEELVFQPIAMPHSTFRQPLPTPVAASMAVGYELRDDSFVALPRDLSQVAPADALVTTGEDMARFMMVHLNEGAIDGKQVLRPETLTEMHQRHFAYHPSLPGRAYGFREELFSSDRRTPGNRRALSHTGGQLGFTSEMILLPQENLGIFICLNRRVAAMRREIVDGLLEQFYPPDSARPVASTQPVQAPRRLEGVYRQVGLPSASVEKVAALLSPEATLTVKSLEDGRVQLGNIATLGQIEPGLLQSEDGKTLVAVTTDDDGNVSHLDVGLTAYERIAWYENPALHRGTLAALLLAIASGLVLWPFKRVSSSVERTGVLSFRLAKFSLVLVAASNIGFVIGLVYQLVAASGDGWDYGLPASLVVLLHVPYLSLGGLFIMAVCWIQMCRTRPCHVLWLAHYGALCIAGAVFLVIADYWNLIGVRP